MPLARIEIEQIQAGRWFAEVEAGGLPGGPPFKRVTATAADFGAIVAAVTAAYFVQVPSAKPAPTPDPAPLATTEFDPPPRPAPAPPPALLPPRRTR